MKITRVEPFILHVPVTGARIADSANQITHWGAPGVVLHTDAGVQGYGYTGTLGYLPIDRLIRQCIADAFSPLLVDQDPRDVRALWHQLHGFPGIRWVGRAGVTQMALAAIDVALWDIKAKLAGVPLWKLLGGSDTKRVEAYNTDGGWLNWSRRELVDCARAMVDGGFRGVKIKVGSPNAYRDLARVEAVREAIGPETSLMVDANGIWDRVTAMKFGRKFADYDVFWLEEPTWFEDVDGHAELARSMVTPVALGEQLHSVDSFRQFITAGAVHFVQPDATRLGGITPCWQVAELAAAHRLPLTPHAGDMMQIHLNLAIAHSACHLMEYIPWLRDCFEEPVTVESGDYRIPQNPGAGTTFKAGVLERFAVE